MSTYIEDAQGNIISDPINETNTKYPFIPKNESDIKDAMDNQLDYQYMYNEDNPVSNIDTDVYDNYRNRVEELRTKTESYYEALEACLVPAEVKGMAFQPWEYVKETDSEGKEKQVKRNSLQYFFQDHPSNISSNYKEYCFRTNKVKFTDDRNHRLIYDREIHILSTKEDEDNAVPFKNVILRTFFSNITVSGEIIENDYCLVRDLENVQLTLDKILTAILAANTRSKDNEKLVVIDNGVEKVVESIADFDLPMQAGQDVDTTVPSTLYNLYAIGWIHAAMIFLNGLAVEWTKALLSVDNIDTFVIVYGLREDMASMLDEAKSITMEYIHLPFKCVYMVGSESAFYTPYESFLNENRKFDGCVPFIIDKRYGAVVEADDTSLNPSIASSYHDRVICVDKNIKYAEFRLDSGGGIYLPKIGVQFCKEFKEFCNNDYRTKLKQFNFIGFEINTEMNNKYSAANPTRLRTLKNNDFNVTWHPFNIVDVRFKNLYNNPRVFKVFYNTKVLYDQDNILRLNTQSGLMYDKYKEYRQSVTANIELYIREVYVLAKKDIGVYVATSDEAFMQGYKYHYVTPYECYLIYNAVQTLLEQPTVTFDSFRKINVINYPFHKKISVGGGGGGGGGGGTGDGFDFVYPEYIYDDPDEEDFFEPVVSDDNSSDTPNDDDNYVGYLAGGFVVFDDEHNFFNSIVTEDTLYDEEHHLREEIRAYWQSIIDADPENKNLMDFLLPLDNPKRKDDDIATPSNMFYMYNGDNRGKALPLAKFMEFCAFEQEEDKLEYDYLKLRFELSYINNMEEGATPVDELIYYFGNVGLISRTDVIVQNYSNFTESMLTELASNIFQADPQMVLFSIQKMNWQSRYILPNNLMNEYRDNFIVYQTYDVDESLRSARYFYNYGYYDENNKPHKINDEWCLRRHLPEMFYWALEDTNHIVDSVQLLDEVFDFTYGFDKSYEENLEAGTNYILGYDADKLEASIKRGVVSITKTGQELLDYMMYHPAAIYTSTDSYKKIQFNTNHDYIVTINNERLYVYLRDDYVWFVREEDGTKSQDNVMYFKFKGQNNYTIEIDQINRTIKDIDKNFTATYSRAVFDNDSQMVLFYNGDTLVVTLQADCVYSFNKLQMSRWNISKQDNYVMIFKNRELYEKYNTIHYSDIAFDVDMNRFSDVTVEDTFEFVFFLNANNTVVSQRYATAESTELTIPNAYFSKSGNPLRVDDNGDKMDKGLYSTITQDYTFDKPAIACHTDVIAPEDVQLLVSVMPSAEGDTYKGSGVNLAYELTYDVYSYRASTSEDDTQRNFRSIQRDEKINGVYRVTKQGGGEYFLTYDGTVPEKTDTITNETTDPQFIDHGYSTNRTISTPYNLYLTSKRQFRYQHNDIVENHEAGFYITLDTSFKYCTKNSHMMVFKNGRLLPPTYYFLRPIINTPIGTVAVVFNVELAAGDRVDTFYVSNDLHHLECDYYDIENQERYIKNGEIRVNKNNNEYKVMGERVFQDNDFRTNYIKMRSPLYAISSKNSVFVFLNGKKVRSDELRDVSNTMMEITTDYSIGNSMQAIRLEVINHLDTQDIIERVYINDGLSHDSSIVTNQFVNTNNPNAYKNTLQINSFSLADLEAYAEESKLDKMLNDMSDRRLNELFYNSITGPMTREGIMDEPDFVNNDVIVDTIVEDFYVEEDGDKFVWHTMHASQGYEGQSNTIFYIGDSESVRVPARWDDESTRALYGSTFNRNKVIKKAIIPEGVESID